jgi:hypothetical protein
LKKNDKVFRAVLQVDLMTYRKALSRSHLIVDAAATVILLAVVIMLWRARNVEKSIILKNVNPKFLDVLTVLICIHVRREILILVILFGNLVNVYPIRNY